MAGYKIVLADEQKMFMQGIKAFFDNVDQTNFNIVSMQSSNEDLMDFIENNEVDILISEINFLGIDPEELISNIKKQNPNIKLLVLSAYNDINLVKSCFRAGIDGYLLKSDNLQKIQEALESINQGQIYLGENIKVSPDIKGNGQEDIKKKRYPIDRFLVRQSMTKRELEILELICMGKSNRKIGEMLYISDHTASVHRKHILKKVGVNTSTDLIKFVEEFEILK